MREVTPTRSTAIELADERKLMRQGYEFLDEKRMLLATEMLRQLRTHQERSEELIAATKSAAQALAACRRAPRLRSAAALSDAGAAGDARQRADPVSRPRHAVGRARRRSRRYWHAAAIDPSPEVKACRAAFETLLWAAADTGARAGNLNRLAREYRRTERRARALEKVLLPEVEEAIKNDRRATRHDGARRSHPHALVIPDANSEIRRRVTMTGSSGV